jgi:integrase
MPRKARNSPHSPNPLPEVAREDAQGGLGAAVKARQDTQHKPTGTPPAVAAPDPLPPGAPAPAAPTPPAMFTVSHLIDSFDAHLAVRVKLQQTEASTLGWYRSQLGKLKAAAGTFPAAELRAPNLVSVELTYHFVRALKALYKWATDEDVALLDRDPFKKLKPPPCGERQRILSRAEMRRLYLACSRPMRRLLFVLSRTIARPGEIRALRWGDIQWDRRLITLTKFKGKRRRRDGVKVRTIPLDRAALRMLRNIYERRQSPGPDAHVWLDRSGRPLTSNGLRCRMRRARVRAGLDPEGVEERVVCYTMRHTSATNATRRGVKDTTLGTIMGHARSSTTNRYQHLAGDDLVDAIDRLATRPRKPTK